MARRLAYTVHVPVYSEVSTESGVMRGIDRWEVFLAGTELPEWAVSSVGDHVYEPGEAPSSPAPEPSPVVEEAPKPEQPAGNASADAWRAYAVAVGADPELVAGMSRGELRATYKSK